MTSAHVGTARGIIRNAAALFLIGALDKGAGLVIAIIVARFLGADAMGLFALLFSTAMLVQIAVSFGMSDCLVRDVAAKRDHVQGIYRSALKVVAGTSLLPGFGLAVAAMLFLDDGTARTSLLIVAIGTPISGACAVSQAVLQGLERMLFLTWVSFIARALSLGFLVYALYHGGSLEFAFFSRLLFQAIVLAASYVAIKNTGGHLREASTSRQLFVSAIPFALNSGLREFGARLPSLILPLTSGLAGAGIFDAANRIRTTLGMVISASIIGLMPALARSLRESRDQSGDLVGYSAKYMCIGMSIVATAIVVLADWIVGLLFGPEFTAAAWPMQILAWTQVVNAVDSVLRQSMLAQGHEFAAIRFPAVGLVAQFALILVLTGPLGLPGAALAVLLSSVLTLSLNLGFVVRHVAGFQSIRHVWLPLAAVSFVAGLILIFDDESLAVRAMVALSAWLLAMTLFRVLPGQELRFIWRIVTHRRAAQAPESRPEA